MCKYCSDWENEHKELIRAELPGNLLKVEVLQDKLALIEQRYGKDQIADGYVKINYCPMCGRKLRI